MIRTKIVSSLTVYKFATLLESFFDFTFRSNERKVIQCLEKKFADHVHSLSTYFFYSSVKSCPRNDSGAKQRTRRIDSGYKVTKRRRQTSAGATDVIEKTDDSHGERGDLGKTNNEAIRITGLILRTICKPVAEYGRR